MQSGQHAVTTTCDMAPGAHGTATSAGNGYVITLVQLNIGLPKLRSGANCVRSTFARRIHLREHTQIQNRSIRIISEEVFVAMSAAAHRLPQSGVYNPLQSIGGIFRTLADLDSAHSIRFR